MLVGIKLDLGSRLKVAYGTSAPGDEEGLCSNYIKVTVRVYILITLSIAVFEKWEQHIVVS